MLSSTHQDKQEGNLFLLVSEKAMYGEQLGEWRFHNLIKNIKV